MRASSPTRSPSCCWIGTTTYSMCTRGGSFLLATVQPDGADVWVRRVRRVVVSEGLTLHSARLQSVERCDEPRFPDACACGDHRARRWPLCVVWLNDEPRSRSHRACC